MIQYYKSIQERKAATGDEGFTLIELLIVIVVLGILAAVVVFALGSVTGNAQVAACQADAKTVETGVQAFNAQPAQPAPIALETGGAAAGNVNPASYVLFSASAPIATQAVRLQTSPLGTINSWPGQASYSLSLGYTAFGAIPAAGTAGQVVVWAKGAVSPVVYDSETSANGCNAA